MEGIKRLFVLLWNKIEDEDDDKVKVPVVTIVVE